MEQEKQWIALSKQLTNLKMHIGQLNKSEQKLMLILPKVSDLLQQHHIAIILTLYSDDSLWKILEETRQIYRKQKDKKILSTIYNIFQIGVMCFLDYDQKYKKTFQGFKTKFNDQCKLEKFLDEKDYCLYEKRKKTLKQLMEIKHSKKEQFAKGQDLRQFINKQLRNMKPQTIADQITVHWLKKQANQCQRTSNAEKHYPDFGYCCNLTFEHSQEYKELEFKNQEFAQIPKWQPSTKKDDKAFKQFKFVDIDILRRKNIQFLNTRGGYIYFGVEKDMQIRKKGRFVGLALTDIDRTNLLKTLFKEFVYKVYPSQGQDLEQSENEEKERLDNFKSDQFKKFTQQVNNTMMFAMGKKVEVELIPMHDQNLLTKKDERGCEKVIVRMKIGAGDPAQVYFMQGERRLPFAYLQTRDPLTMFEFTSLIQKRQKAKYDKVLKVQEPISHYICINDLKFVSESEEDEYY